MDVNEIIRQLQQAEGELIGEMPPEDEYIVRRKERMYGELIDSLQRDRYAEGEGGETVPENRDIERFIWIPGEDIGFPEINSERIAREISREGVEALAWYRSFHWRPCERWGIYILDKGLYFVAERVFGAFDRFRGGPYDTPDLLLESLRLLFLHEFFHYITDIAASTLEIASGLRRAYYIEYVKNVYMRPGNSDEPLEEALANAFAFNRVPGWQFQRPGWRFRRSVRQFMKNQPGGYSAFDQYIRKSDFARGRRELGTCIFRAQRLQPGVTPLETLFDCYTRDVSYADVPVYIVPTITDSRYRLGFIRAIPRDKLDRSQQYVQDYQRLPRRVQRKVSKTLSNLQHGVQHPGLGFEKLNSKGNNKLFSVRVDKGYRLILREVPGGRWELVTVGTHDDVYRTINRYC
jgi:mRNA-degrading endonuclease RelE of RelBE toxin-antitoxin system